MNAIPTAVDLARIADRCVRCGLCLPHCPTYRLARNEAESPRGRIALIQGRAEGHLEDSPVLGDHLAHCLECLACERACPTLVPFGILMDGARAASWAAKPPWRRNRDRAWLAFLASPTGARLSAVLARLYRYSGLARLVAGSGALRWHPLAARHRLVLQLAGPPRINPPPGQTETTRGPIGLFLGCIARAAQPGAIAASVEVLRWLGYEVRLPPGQGCCGGMHRHHGLPQDADRRLETNARAFTGLTGVGIASACVAELRTHPPLGETQEICRFLADLDWPIIPPQPPQPLLRVAIHLPCSQRNRLRDEGAARDLLRRLPHLELVDLPDNAFCCGAAGTYLLEQPTLSRTLLQPKIDHLAQLGARVVVTTNTGCALHLAAGIQEAGLAVEVLHPVQLIARYLNRRS